MPDTGGRSPIDPARWIIGRNGTSVTLNGITACEWL